MDYPRLMESEVQIMEKEPVQPTTIPQLATWPISGRSTETGSFQRRLPPSYLNRDESKPVNLMTHSSTSGMAGAAEEVLIRFLVL